MRLWRKKDMNDGNHPFYDWYLDNEDFVIGMIHGIFFGGMLGFLFGHMLSGCPK